MRGHRKPVRNPQSSESAIDRNGWVWSKIAAQVRRRDGVCVWQDETCAGRPEVDHILSRFEGGTDELTNLRLLCRSHHVRRHNGTPPGPGARRSPLVVRQSIFRPRVW